MERPRLLREWVGLRVRLVKEVQLRSGKVYPVGTVGEVISTHRGRFTILVGSQDWIYKLPPNAVELQGSAQDCCDRAGASPEGTSGVATIWERLLNAESPESH